VGEQTGHYSDATKAITALAAGGKIAGDQLAAAARGAVEFGTLTDQSVDKAGDVFERLAADPVKTLTELNDRMHFLTASQLEEVTSLQSLGDKTDAARLATQLFVDVVDQRVEAYKGKLGNIVKIWGDITGGIGAAYDSAKKF